MHDHYLSEFVLILFETVESCCPVVKPYCELVLLVDMFYSWAKNYLPGTYLLAYLLKAYYPAY